VKGKAEGKMEDKMDVFEPSLSLLDARGRRRPSQENARLDEFTR